MFEKLGDSIVNTFHTFTSVLSSFDSLADFLDIIFVTLLIYGLVRQLIKTQSVQIIKGIIFALVIYGAVLLFQMEASKRIFSMIMSNILVIIVVLFHTEIRQFLARVGQADFRSLLMRGDSYERNQILQDAINATCRACASMSEDKIGSLIVFQRKSFLGDLEKSGVEIDSKTTTEMLLSVFFPKAALHDGAIIIKDGRIIAARCIVPLKNDHAVKEKVGTRHRAAIEVSRGCDAIAVVTSEETGIISIAVEGQLIRGISDSELREHLSELLLPDESSDSTIPKKLKKIFRRGDKSNEQK